MIQEFITYFNFRNKIINGWKIVKIGSMYDVYTYTSCKKLGNWQLFFSNYSFDKLLKYFEENLFTLEEQEKDCNNDYQKEWVNAEKNWRKETLEQFILTR